MQQTTNFKLNLPEGSDLFAPMLDYNPNWSAIDNQMQLNRLNSMQEADCIFAGGVFQIKRKVIGSTFIKFTAPANYTAGNTFTVDGEVYTAGLAGNFAALPDGAFTSGNIVVGYLDMGDAKKLALMTGSSPLPKDIDAKTLEGHPASYFATQVSIAEVNATATSAGSVANNAATWARNAAIKFKQVWKNVNPLASYGAMTISLNVDETMYPVGFMVGFIPDTNGGNFQTLNGTFIPYNLNVVSQVPCTYSGTAARTYFSITGSRTITVNNVNRMQISQFDGFGIQRSNNTFVPITKSSDYMIPVQVVAVYQTKNI